MQTYKPHVNGARQGQGLSHQTHVADLEIVKFIFILRFYYNPVFSNTCKFANAMKLNGVHIHCTCILRSKL